MDQYKASIRESALLLGNRRSLVGILTERLPLAPGEGKARKAVLLLNAGLIHRIGPNRIYVKLARLLADMGFIVLRFDLSGVGDSGPRKDKMPISESVVEEIKEAMDHIESIKEIQNFVLIGLCAGAANAFRMGTIDPRVKDIILINPVLPETQQVERMRQASHYRYKAFLNPNSWINFFLMKVDYRSMFQLVGYSIKKRLLPNAIRKQEPEEVTRFISLGFNALRQKNVKILLVNSTVEVGLKYFKEILGDEYKSMTHSGLLTTKMLDGSDHTVTPLKCQSALIEIISEWMSRNSGKTSAQ